LINEWHFTGPRAKQNRLTRHVNQQELLDGLVQSVLIVRDNDEDGPDVAAGGVPLDTAHVVRRTGAVQGLFAKRITNAFGVTDTKEREKKPSGRRKVKRTYMGLEAFMPNSWLIRTILLMEDMTECFSRPG
jgi:hypothetical protein